MPFVSPMLAVKFGERLPYSFFLQPKLDGVRAIAAADGIWSRSGRKITSCAHIERELRSFFDCYPDLILDGELYHHDLRDNLWTIISLANSRATREAGNLVLEFHVFDIIRAGIPFSHRSAELIRLRASLFGPESTVKFVPTSVASNRHELDCQLSTALSDGYEGVMIRADALYVSGRSSNLLKFKPFDDAEFDVLGFEEVRGTLSGFAKRVILRFRDGRTFKAGLKCPRSLARVLLKSSCRSATVRYLGLTPSGLPRSPVAVAFHH